MGAIPRLPLRSRIPLRLLLAGCFGLQVTLAVVLTGYLSLLSGQRSVMRLAEQLQYEMSDRIAEKVQDYLTAPGRVNELNAIAFQNSQLHPTDLDQLEAQFMALHKLFDTVNHISFGSATGDYVAVRRNLEGDGFEILRVDRRRNDTLYTYSTDTNGQSRQLLREKPHYDPRERPWYKSAVAAGHPGWSTPYRYFLASPLGISHVYPVYAARQQLQGVLATDFDLSDISQFLQTLAIGQSGQAFIVDGAGHLIATSQPEELFQQRAGQTQAILAIASQNPVIVETVPLLQAHPPQANTQERGSPLRLSTAAGRYFVSFSSLKAPGGMDWQLAIVLPETDFRDQIDRNRQQTLLLCLVVLILTSVLATKTSRWLAHPFYELTEAAQNLSAGRWHPLIYTRQREIPTPYPAEVDIIAQSFRQIAGQLQQSSVALAQKDAEVRRQVDELTASLQQRETELRSLFGAMKELIFVQDINGRYLTIAPTSPDLLYRPAEELIGKTVHEVFPPDKAELFIAYIHQALAIKSMITVEYSLPIQQREVWFSATITPIARDSVIWVVRDISDRKRAEAALKLSEEKFEKVFRASPSLIAITLLEDERFVEVNDSFVDACGYTRDEIIGKTATELNLWVNEDTRARMISLLRDQGAFNNYEYEFRTRSGERKTGLLSADIIDISGVRYGLYVVNDITERKQAESALQAEQAKSESLLLNVLPKTIADRLREHSTLPSASGHSAFIAEQFDNVSILFADIAGFTQISSHISPRELVGLLNHVFSLFDDLSEQYRLEKIKTIGDAYMVAGGLPSPRPDHAEAIANMALDMQYAVQHLKKHYHHPVQIRIGIHSGTVVAGVIGHKKFIYDLWGDTVNVASRMESQGAVQRIQVTDTTFNLLKHKFIFEERGLVDVKGKGLMKTYWLLDRRSL
ncbi:adenylate/guanylate cyclase domain-containing protein [Trichothermofontia sp.]